MRYLSTLVLGAAVALGGCATAAQSPHSSTISRSHCSGLAAEDQDVSQMFAADNVRRVEPLYLEDDTRATPRTRASTRTHRNYLAGAKLYVRAPQQSSAFVERVLQCHAAKDAADTDHPNDPLRVAGVRNVDVRQSGAHLSIAISASDAEGGRAILKRAEALRSQPTQVEIRQVAKTDLDAVF